MSWNLFWRLRCLYYSNHTLYNAILRIVRNFLKTRENITISTHPFYHINLGWFSWEWSKIFFFFRKKKIQNGRLKKSSFFKIANSQNFFAKISQIGTWVSRIEWCEGHWFPWKSAQIYMVEWMGRNFDVFPGFQKISCYA